MTATIATTRQIGKSAPAETCGQSRNFLRTNYLVMQRARAIFPQKTALHLAQITGYPVRTCEYWLSKSTLPSEALAALIRSEHGRDFLAAIMTEARPKWWRAVLSLFASIDALSLQRAAKRRLREAIDADTDISAALSRADALLVRDEDFYRPHADAVGAVARLSHRALAPKT